MKKYDEIGKEIGELVSSKQKQYGNSVEKTGQILKALYPHGVFPHQYSDLLLVVRILDKVCRIASRGPDGLDGGGESPYKDLAGYSLIGITKDEK